MQQQLISTCLQRTWDGLLVHVKLSEQIERYFRQISNGSVGPISVHGRLWRRPENIDEVVDFQVYTLPKELSFNMQRGIDTPYGYSLNSLCKALISQEDCINLSFLRIQGASADEGVSFLVPGVFSTRMIETLKEGIATTTSIFYREYMKTMKETVVISSIME